MTENDAILFDSNEGVARIVLNRPEKMNSFNTLMHAQLRDALDRVQSDRSIRALVITGAGRGFCAGQDLADPSIKIGPDLPPVDLGEIVEQNYKPLVMRLQNIRVPTLAAVNGIAAGAGASLALACDLVIAKKSASFVQAFSKIGLVPDTGSTTFLLQRVGMARALGLTLLAEKLSAEKAVEWGLIWAAVDDDAFEDHVSKLAKQLAVAPTKALVRTRQALHAAASHTLEQQLSFEGGLMRELGRSADFLEGVAAFAQKRTPNFTGD